MLFNTLIVLLCNNVRKKVHKFDISPTLKEFNKISFI